MDLGFKQRRLLDGCPIVRKAFRCLTPAMEKGSKKIVVKLRDTQGYRSPSKLVASLKKRCSCSSRNLVKEISWKWNTLSKKHSQNIPKLSQTRPKPLVVWSLELIQFQCTNDSPTWNLWGVGLFTHSGGASVQRLLSQPTLGIRTCQLKAALCRCSRRWMTAVLGRLVMLFVLPCFASHFVQYWKIPDRSPPAAVLGYQENVFHGLPDACDESGLRTCHAEGPSLQHQSALDEHR